ncbi:hypothetical protein CPB83DRAFT_853056 [Crepidotus variabilis]|uniref:Zn(2)-C6 fungal-type domain-containing protein n=1 Tax=Crepidotus variabilis TaxID=179855 RepID=A0A9P6JR20_9AGAR|nr:hypothetical protein CPB83DRAFT_853056 [Crepidotus variabilis]
MPTNSTKTDSERTETGHAEEHLTIRIPNPKAYMSMQSQWTSQRGKARCDYCRQNNLKCDRILPSCNYCTLENQGECSYAPTPNTSHRGIPRCDRCREHNLKCDRDIPSCSYCKDCGEEKSCSYSSRLKSKQDVHGHSDEATTSRWPLLPGLADKPEEEKPRPSYYRERSSEGSNKRSRKSDGAESDPDKPHRGRFTADFAQPKRTSSHSSTYNTPAGSDVEIIAHSSSSKPQILIKNGRIEAWTHPAFISLPNFAYKELIDVDPVEMPKRHEFDAALEAFLRGIMSTLRETAIFSVSQYTKLAKCLTSGDMAPLSERLNTWAAVHKLSSGSTKYNLVLVPRDSVFSMTPNLAEADRRSFVEDLLKGGADLEQLQVHHYDRLPVQNQLYDILSYAHRYHYPAASMLLEVVRLRFASITWPMAELYVKLCPLCSIRSKQGQEKSHRKRERSDSINSVASPIPRASPL